MTETEPSITPAVEIEIDPTDEVGKVIVEQATVMLQGIEDA